MIRIYYFLLIVHLTLALLNLGKILPLQMCWPTLQSTASSWRADLAAGGPESWHSQGDTNTQPDLLNEQTPNSPEPSAGLPQASPSRPTGVQAGNPQTAKQIQQELRQRLSSLLLLSHPFHQLPPPNYHPARAWVVGRREGRCIRAELSPLFPYNMHLSKT